MSDAKQYVRISPFRKVTNPPSKWQRMVSVWFSHRECIVVPGRDGLRDNADDLARALIDQAKARGLPLVLTEVPFDLRR